MSNPAGFWIRLTARLIDALMLGGIMYFITLILGMDLNSQNVTTAETIVNLAYFLIVPVVWFGYTVGKRVMTARIVKTDGEPVTLWTMILRELVTGILYGITLGTAIIISAFMVGLRADKRALHDFIAGTYVTRDKPE